MAEVARRETVDHTARRDGNSSELSADENEVGDDPTQPLLRDPWIRRHHVHYMLVGALGIILIGGITVGIWLLVAGGSGGIPYPTFELVNRTAWGARSPENGTEPLQIKPAIRVVIIHSTTQQCHNLDACCKIVRNIQARHMDTLNYSDIAYNFLVGGDGRTYEGRGWDIAGAYNHLMNPKALGIAFIGDFEYTDPPAQQLAEARDLLDESVKRKKLAPDYKLVGHRQVSETESPGQKLFDIIKTWPHWEQCYKKTC